MLLELLHRLVVWIGFCWLLANWTNTLHGKRHSRKLLDKLLIIHHLGILVSPIILLGAVDLSLSLLSQHPAGSNDLNLLNSAPFMVLACYLGSLGFFIQVIRYHYQLLTAPGKIIQKNKIKFPINQYRVPQLRQRHWHYFPANEVWEIDFNTKELYLDRRWQAYQGLRILHLSDLHIIGFMNLEYYVKIMQRAIESKPDIIVFSGDLLDHDEYQPWLETIFKPLAESYPCYYVLGNHDWTKTTYETTRKIMHECGWQDLAGKVLHVNWRDLPVCLLGSELPWMNDNPDSSLVPTGALSLLVSHSPDQISWASKREVGLVLAGHTHGGQIVFPLLGPIYSPSIYGTKYSAGIFQRQNTVMHVSRGIGGENPLRLNCPPEMTLIMLKTHDTKK